MKNIFLLLAIAMSVFIQSCGDDDKNRDVRFVSTETFSFNISIDPSTLIEIQPISLSSSYPSRPETYIISTPEELTNFIQMTNIIGAEDHFQNMFSNLDTQSYFLIMQPSCPAYYEYSGYVNSPPVISIKMKLFTVDDALCPASFIDTYHVLKGTKL